MTDQDVPLTVAEAAEFLNTSERHVRRMVAERRIAFVKVGHFVRFRRADLERFLDEHRIEPRPSLGATRRGRR